MEVRWSGLWVWWISLHPPGILLPSYSLAIGPRLGVFKPRESKNKAKTTTTLRSLETREGYAGEKREEAGAQTGIGGWKEKVSEGWKRRYMGQAGGQGSVVWECILQ